MDRPKTPIELAIQEIRDAHKDSGMIYDEPPDDILRGILERLRDAFVEHNA